MAEGGDPSPPTTVQGAALKEETAAAAVKAPEGGQLRVRGGGESEPHAEELLAEVAADAC